MFLNNWHFFCLRCCVFNNKIDRYIWLVKNWWTMSKISLGSIRIKTHIFTRVVFLSKHSKKRIRERTLAHLVLYEPVVRCLWDPRQRARVDVGAAVRRGLTGGARHPACTHIHTYTPPRLHTHTHTHTQTPGPLAGGARPGRSACLTGALRGGPPPPRLHTGSEHFI